MIVSVEVRLLLRYPIDHVAATDNAAKPPLSLHCVIGAQLERLLEEKAPGALKSGRARMSITCC